MVSSNLGCLAYNSNTGYVTYRSKSISGREISCYKVNKQPLSMCLTTTSLTSNTENNDSKQITIVIQTEQNLIKMYLLSGECHDICLHNHNITSIHRHQKGLIIEANTTDQYNIDNKYFTNGYHEIYSSNLFTLNHPLGEVNTVYNTNLIAFPSHTHKDMRNWVILGTYNNFIIATDENSNNIYLFYLANYTEFQSLERCCWDGSLIDLTLPNNNNNTTTNNNNMTISSTPSSVNQQYTSPSFNNNNNVTAGENRTFEALTGTRDLSHRPCIPSKLLSPKHNYSKRSITPNHSSLQPPGGPQPTDPNYWRSPHWKLKSTPTVTPTHATTTTTTHPINPPTPTSTGGLDIAAVLGLPRIGQSLSLPEIDKGEYQSSLSERGNKRKLSRNYSNNSPTFGYSSKSNQGYSSGSGRQSSSHLTLMNNGGTHGINTGGSGGGDNNNNNMHSSPTFEPTSTSYKYINRNVRSPLTLPNPLPSEAQHTPLPNTTHHLNTTGVHMNTDTSINQHPTNTSTISQLYADHLQSPTQQSYYLIPLTTTTTTITSRLSSKNTVENNQNNTHLSLLHTGRYRAGFVNFPSSQTLGGYIHIIDKQTEAIVSSYYIQYTHPTTKSHTTHTTHCDNNTNNSTNNTNTYTVIDWLNAKLTLIPSFSHTNTDINPLSYCKLPIHISPSKVLKASHTLLSTPYHTTTPTTPTSTTANTVPIYNSNSSNSSTGIVSPISTAVITLDIDRHKQYTIPILLSLVYTETQPVVMLSIVGGGQIGAVPLRRIICDKYDGKCNIHIHSYIRYFFIINVYLLYVYIC